MMYKLKLLLILCVAMILSVGCGKKDTVTVLTQDEENIVAVPILLRIDPETGEEEYTDLIEGFNKEYAGKYRIDVQWIKDTEQGYRERLKILNVYDRLPIIITDAAFSPDFHELMVSNERYLNLFRRKRRVAGVSGKVIGWKNLYGSIEHGIIFFGGAVL